MVLYKSLCRDIKTFHGVTFRYGETKAVNGYIHDPRFICIGKAQPKSKIEVEAAPAKAEVANVESSKKAEPKAEKKAESKATTKPEKKEDSKKDDKKKAETKVEAKTEEADSKESNIASSKKD